MKVREMIEKLGMLNPESEIFIPNETELVSVQSIWVTSNGDGTEKIELHGDCK